MARLGQFRRDTHTNWTSRNPVLADGEYILVAMTDSSPRVYQQRKCGDGVTKYSALSFLGDPCVQQTGDNEFQPMSQKAVTGELTKRDQKIVQLDQKTSDVEPVSIVKKHIYKAGINIMSMDYKSGYIGLDGNIIQSETFVYSDYTPIAQGMEYTITGMFTSGAVNAIYDSNKVKISIISGNPLPSGTTSKTFTAPTKAAFIRCSCRKAEIINFALKSSLDYDNIAPLDGLNSTNDSVATLKSKVETDEGIAIENAKLSNTIFAKAGSDIAKGYALEQGYINSKDEIIASDSWLHSEYIPITNNTQLKYNGYITNVAVINIYDALKKKVATISGQPGTSGGTKEVTFNTGDASKYIRVSVGKQYLDTLKLAYASDVDTTAKKQELSSISQDIKNLHDATDTYPSVVASEYNILEKVAKDDDILSNSVVWINGYWRENGVPEDYETLWRRTSEMQPVVGGAAIMMNQSIGTGNPKVLVYTDKRELIGSIVLTANVPLVLSKNVAFINVSYLSSTSPTFSFIFKYSEDFARVDTKTTGVDVIQTDFKSANNNIEVLAGVMGGNRALYKIKPNIQNQKFRLFIRYSIDFDCNTTKGVHPIISFVNGDKKCNFNLYSEPSGQVIQSKVVDGKAFDIVNPIIACKSGFGYTALSAERKCLARELPYYRDIRGIDLASLRLKMTGDVDLPENQDKLTMFNGAKLSITDSSVTITKDSKPVFSFPYTSTTKIEDLFNAINATSEWECKSLGYKNVLLKDISKCSDITLISTYRKEYFNVDAGHRLDCYPFYFSKSITEQVFDIEIVCDGENLCAVFDGQNDGSFNVATNTTLKKYIPFIDSQLEIYIGGEKESVFNGTIKDIRLDINTIADAEIYKNYRIISNYNKALSVMMGHGMWQGEEVNGKIPAFEDKTNLEENEVACIPVEWRGMINPDLPNIAMSTERMQRIATRADQAGWCNINPNRIKDYFLPNNDLPKKSWCIIFDDQEWYIYTDYRLREVFERNGVRGNFAVSSTSLVTPEIQRQFLLMQREGYAPLIHGTLDEKITDMSSSTMYGDEKTPHSIRSVATDAREHDIISNIWVYSNGLQTAAGIQAMSHQSIGIGIMTNAGQNYYVCKASNQLFLHRWNVSDKNDFQELIDQGLI